MKNLDRHQPVQMALPSQKDRAHAARTEQRNQFTARRGGDLVISFQRLARNGRAGAESWHDDRRIIDVRLALSVDDDKSRFQAYIQG